MFTLRSGQSFDNQKTTWSHPVLHNPQNKSIRKQRYCPRAVNLSSLQKGLLRLTDPKPFRISQNCPKELFNFFVHSTEIILAYGQINIKNTTGQNKLQAAFVFASNKTANVHKFLDTVSHRNGYQSVFARFWFPHQSQGCRIWWWRAIISFPHG